MSNEINSESKGKRVLQTKRYSVFVSSTYDDLRDERLKVYDAILTLHGIPVGMETFSASSADLLSAIKRLIDTCDYFVVISQARYGTIHTTLNKSFTELELDYAEEKGIPVLRFIHKDVGVVLGNLGEDTDKGKKQLEKFHQRLKNAGQNCKFFTSPDELAK